MNDDILTYNQAQTEDRKAICDRLAQELTTGLPDAQSKIWHGHPVWFLDGNPITGYDVQKTAVRLLFWSGQSFEEPALAPSGTFKAAEARYQTIEQIISDDLQRWLSKAKTIQWDYKNIVKRQGRLERLK
jgi:hypothetical protein